MQIKSKTMGILIFVIIFGGIGATLAVDLWSTTSNKTPAKYTEGEYAGNYNPADIRGSYTFSEVSELFEIDLQILYQAFGIPVDTDGEKIKTKDLENLYKEAGVEIGNESVQVFVALYKNLTITLDESYLPKQASELILQANKELTKEQIDYLEKYTIDYVELTESEEASEEVSSNSTENETSIEASINSTEVETSEEASEETENKVNGSATFQKVLDAGVTVEELEEIIGTSVPPTNQTVKDYCMEAGLSFSDVKEKLNDLIEMIGDE